MLWEKIIFLEIENFYKFTGIYDALYNANSVWGPDYMEKKCPAQVILARSSLDCNFLNELRKLLHREKYPSRLTGVSCLAEFLICFGQYLG